ncbi:MAG: flagellar hook-associated protein FlgK [Acidobacteria bacterium]|nr:flagellar hook-associated protein FlgK [Acidobacteriota bacterium]
MGAMNALMDASRSALANAQTAIDVTAGNIANQNTVGYARRVATFSTKDTVQIGNIAQGRGANISVSAQRDRVLDQRVQYGTQSQSAADARLSALQSVESIFTLNASGSDGAGIGDSMNGLFSSFRALQADPTGISTRQSVLNAAQTFADAMNGASARLNGLQNSLGSQITDSISQVNTLTAQIADLNLHIATTSGDTSSLEDQRQSVLASLSALVGFNQVAGDHNMISLTTSDGTSLVSGQIPHTLSVANVSGGMHVISSGGTDVTATISGGSIGGMLQARNVDIPSVQNALDQLTYSVATAVNTDNSNGQTTAGVAGGDIFSISANANGAAGAIRVSATNIASIAAAATSEGTTGGSNAGAIAGLSNTSIVNGKTPSSYLAMMLTQLGGTVQNATNDSTTAADSLKQATTQRDGLSGVSLDEEAANLTQYQRSYQAAAKIFAIVNELLANSINLGNDVAVS